MLPIRNWLDTSYLDIIVCQQYQVSVAHKTVVAFLQESASRIAELEANNGRVLQELADFKAESKELRNQDLTIKRMEAQLGQLKAQLQNKVSLHSHSQLSHSQAYLY